VSGRRPTERDRRRRTLGQNLLVDPTLIDRLVQSVQVEQGELVVDLGAGCGSLTTALADAGAEVWAVERDNDWLRQLRRNAEASLDPTRIRVIPTDLRSLRLPRSPFRVVSNPPFGLTTTILAMLLDDPARGPLRADLVLQREVAEKFSRQPAATLRAAAWSPWWQFELGLALDRNSFRPRPGVDASVLTITRRDPPILPTRLAPGFREALRPTWSA
jgi:23S rRNA (adenine-N6)-dimethyltransferase